MAQQAATRNSSCQPRRSPSSQAPAPTAIAARPTGVMACHAGRIARSAGSRRDLRGAAWRRGPARRGGTWGRKGLTVGRGHRYAARSVGGRT